MGSKKEKQLGSQYQTENHLDGAIDTDAVGHHPCEQFSGDVSHHRAAGEDGANAQGVSRCLGKGGNLVVDLGVGVDAEQCNSATGKIQEGTAFCWLATISCPCSVSEVCP